LRRQLL